jgi:V8-like Glu-specific endopeptidase
MATTDDAALKKLTAGPRPPVKMKFVDREEVRKYVKSSGKTTSAMGAGAAPTKYLGDLQADSTIKTTFDQVPITDTTKFPNSAIGVLLIQYGTSSKYGTAALISPNAVLTTGAVLPDADWTANDWTMQFIPGYNQGATPFGVIDVIAGQGWPPSARGGSVENDYAVWQLASPVGSTTGWFNVYSSTDPNQYSLLPTINLFSAGYPSESSQIQATNFAIKGAAPYDGGMVLTTNAFADGGWVGGPLWTDRQFLDTTARPPFLIAIYTGGDTAGSGGDNQLNTGGTDMNNLFLYAEDHWL